jgi:hypothetical protein
MFGDGLAAVLATAHAFFRDSIDASRLVAAAVGVGAPFGVAAVVDAPGYVLFVFAAGVGLATYYVLHYPIRYYDPWAGESVNWDAAAVAVLLFAGLLPGDASAMAAITLAVAIVGLWVTVVTMARLDVHAPPKWYHDARRDAEEEQSQRVEQESSPHVEEGQSPRVERAVAWLVATPLFRAVRSAWDACWRCLRTHRPLAWGVGAAASGVGFLTAGFVLDLPGAVAWALLIGLAPLVYYGTDPDVPDVSVHWHRNFLRVSTAGAAGDIVVSADGSMLAHVVSTVAFALLLYGVTAAEQVRLGTGFVNDDGAMGGDGGAIGDDGAVIDGRGIPEEATSSGGIDDS